MTHPNTIASILAAGAAWLGTYLLAKYAGVHLSKNQVHGVDLGVTAVVLFVGRRGVKGAASAVWNGFWNGTQKPALAATPTPIAPVDPAIPTEGVQS